eukprot:1194835-Prorocentrum_minimum.AAC.2
MRQTMLDNFHGGVNKQHVSPHIGAHDMLARPHSYVKGAHIGDRQHTSYMERHVSPDRLENKLFGGIKAGIRGGGWGTGHNLR